LPTPEALADATRRTIALVERELEGEPNMLTMRELEIALDDPRASAESFGRGR
jgi:hypothetical protein